MPAEGQPFAGPRKGAYMRRKGYWPFLVPGVLASILVIVVPLVMTVYTSFTKWNGVGEQRWIGFDNYTRLFEDSLFWGSFSNILLLMLAVSTPDPTWRAAILVTLCFLTVAGVIGDKLSAWYQRIGRRALDAKDEPSAVGLTTA